MKNLIKNLIYKYVKNYVCENTFFLFKPKVLKGGGHVPPNKFYKRLNKKIL